EWRWFYVWLLLSIIAGFLLAFFQVNTSTSYKRRMKLIVVCCLFWFGIAFSYANSIYILFPEQLGGHIRRAVMFKWKEGIPLRNAGDGFTETVWVVYEDWGSYWIQHLNQSRDKYVVDRLDRVELGLPVRSSNDPQQPYPRLKRWQLQIPR